MVHICGVPFFASPTSSWFFSKCSCRLWLALQYFKCVLFCVLCSLIWDPWSELWQKLWQDSMTCATDWRCQEAVDTVHMGRAGHLNVDRKERLCKERSYVCQSRSWSASSLLTFCARKTVEPPPASLPNRCRQICDYCWSRVRPLLYFHSLRSCFLHDISTSDISLQG